MSELIVEMEMPKDCLWYEDGKEGRCPFLDDGDCCRGQSDEANEVAETWSDLKKGCPIKGELPDEHGRLIDEAVFCENVVKYSHQSLKTIGKALDATPTIIDMTIIAEERKHDEQIH